MRTYIQVVGSLFLIAALAGCGIFDAEERIGKPMNASGHEEVVLKIAYATEAGGNLAGAERLYKQAASMSPQSVMAHLELAEFYKRHHDNAKALDTLRDTLAIEPENTVILRDLANMHITSGEPKRALALLSRAIETHTGDALLYNSKGAALDQLGKYQAAQEAYQRALELAPDEAMTFKANLSMSYMLSHAYDKAIELLSPLLDTPGTTPTIRQNLALAYGLKGESKKALKLGLQDLTPEEAQENLKFYRMIATPHADSSTKKAAAAASAIGEVFPEEKEDTLALSELAPKASSPYTPPLPVLPLPILRPGDIQ